MSFKDARPADSRNHVREDRYQAIPGEDGWTVMDRLSGLPAASNGRDFIKLRRTDARDISNELNNCEREGKPSPLL